jgi:Uma2 family endonuclease
MIRQAKPVDSAVSRHAVAGHIPSACMTVDEFLEWEPVDASLKYELDEGIIYVSPSPVRWHQKVVLYIAQELDHFVRERNLGEVSVDTDSVINRRRQSVYRPDANAC